MRIAIVGSREYPFLEDVQRLVQVIHRDDVEMGRPSTIVSGGARGVDITAEQEALRLGMSVHSYRVWQISPEECGVEEWVVTPEKSYVRQMLEMPRFGNVPHHGGESAYTAALFFRNTLIVRNSDRVVAFRAGNTPGTTASVDFALALEKPVREYKIGEDERLVVA